MRKFIIISMLLSQLPSLGQESKKHIRTGNKMYFDGKYVEAEQNYQKALATEPKSYKGAFNNADALYKQEKYAEAANQFRMLAEKSESKNAKSSAYHNLGNSLLQTQKFEESIEAYKNALRNNPEDNDTRYNLAYAQMMLKQQQQQQQEQDKQDDKKDEEKDDEKKEEQKKDQQEKQDKKEDQEKKEQQKQEMSKEDVERLLNALNNEEKKIQENLKRQKAKGVKVKIEKDW